ncbi:MAG: tRNA uridine-5-carboxymethylaminomethyl(34) synthesis GTPase MnmE [Oscillospiraceae bacterium]|jgi:tRNA modification GTPase|nr:tRNA uridine-5-carboxymethylaminomethyl(34) synthesis GTPase MnmE [Oscillospiraceae bacterium]
MKTIAALATPPLSGALGIIRISGDKAFLVASSVFAAKNSLPLAQWPPRTLVMGGAVVDGVLLDEGMAVRMVAPYSYTGEDTVELHLHGSIPALRAILEAIYKAGASPAAPGEFTRRAFLHGKLSLSQAEAVADLVTAETRDAARNAAGQLEGRLGRVFAETYDTLAGLLARFYAAVDYPEEDISPGEPAAILQTVLDTLDDLLLTAGKGLLLREGLRCSILGKPNVGKSSLLNAFVGHERAIVSSVPGTTRDTLEETVTVGGVKLRLTDSAGIRETKDDLEAIGVSRARGAAENAELLLVVLDGSQEMDDADRAVLDLARDRACLVLLNKADLPQKLEREQIEAAFLHVLPISAKFGQGLDAVYSTLRRLYEAGDTLYDGSVLTNERQADAIRRTMDAVRNALSGLRDGVTPDAVLAELERALACIGELTGRRVREEIVDEIFAKFCVGK